VQRAYNLSDEQTEYQVSDRLKLSSNSSAGRWRTRRRMPTHWTNPIPNYEQTERWVLKRAAFPP